MHFKILKQTMTEVLFWHWVTLQRLQNQDNAGNNRTAPKALGALRVLQTAFKCCNVTNSKGSRFLPISRRSPSLPPKSIVSKPDWWLFIACFFMARGESEWVCGSAGREKTVQDYTLVFHSWASLCHSSPQSNKHMSLLISSALFRVFFFSFALLTSVVRSANSDT